MLEHCTNCRSLILFGARRDALGAFCSWQCQMYRRQVSYGLPDFCPTCLAETSDQSSGSTTTINGVGTSLFGYGQACPECNSVVRTKCVCVFFPLIPLGTYRVKFTTPSQFISRRLVRRLPRGPAASHLPAALGSPFAVAEPAGAALAPLAAGASAFGCPYCGSTAPAGRRQQVTSMGWMVFGLLLVVCFPLCLLGLLLRQEHLYCETCSNALTT